MANISAGLQDILSSHLPEHVNDLVLFEDFDEDIDAMWAADGPYRGELVRTPSQPLGHCLARLSGLRSLRASFIVDAADFFAELFRNPDDDKTWRDLAHLSLTSPLLGPTAHPDATRSLLVAAASAAARMPGLEVLELWHGRRGQACLFRFWVLPDGVVDIFHRSTWDSRLDPGVLAAWMDVSTSRGGDGVRMGRREVFDAGVVRSHGDAIYYLGLEEVVHPVSLAQIRREAQHFGPDVWKGLVSPAQA